MTIKVGDKVWTKSGFGVVVDRYVVDRYREPLGWYFIYEVQLEDGTIIITKNVYMDK